MDMLSDKKELLNKEIQKLGYDSLRVSIFNQKDENRMEWQTRIEYDLDTGVYQIYSLGDRASLIGKITNYTSFHSAKNVFLNKLELTVKYNKLRVSRGEQPEYSSPLWDDE